MINLISPRIPSLNLETSTRKLSRDNSFRDKFNERAITSEENEYTNPPLGNSFLVLLFYFTSQLGFYTDAPLIPFTFFQSLIMLWTRRVSDGEQTRCFVETFSLISNVLVYSEKGEGQIYVAIYKRERTAKNDF